MTIAELLEVTRRYKPDSLRKAVLIVGISEDEGQEWLLQAGIDRIDYKHLPALLALESFAWSLGFQAATQYMDVKMRRS